MMLVASLCSVLNAQDASQVDSYDDQYNLRDEIDNESTEGKAAADLAEEIRKDKENIVKVSAKFGGSFVRSTTHGNQTCGLFSSYLAPLQRISVNALFRVPLTPNVQMQMRTKNFSLVHISSTDVDASLKFYELASVAVGSGYNPVYNVFKSHQQVFPRVYLALSPYKLQLGLHHQAHHFAVAYVPSSHYTGNLMWCGPNEERNVYCMSYTGSSALGCDLRVRYSLAATTALTGTAESTKRIMDGGVYGKVYSSTNITHIPTRFSIRAAGSSVAGGINRYTVAARAAADLSDRYRVDFKAFVSRHGECEASTALRITQGDCRRASLTLRCGASSIGGLFGSASFELSARSIFKIAQ